MGAQFGHSWSTSNHRGSPDAGMHCEPILGEEKINPWPAPCCSLNSYSSKNRSSKHKPRPAVGRPGVKIRKMESGGWDRQVVSENSSGTIAHQGSLTCAHPACVLGGIWRFFIFAVYRVLQCMFTSVTCQYVVEETFSIKMKMH